MTETYNVRARLWIWKSDKAPASWHFVTIEGEVADAIRLSALMIHGRLGGWGSVKITAQIGDSRWQTSLFPHKESGGWILPVKAAIRKAEGVVAGDVVETTITI